MAALKNADDMAAVKNPQDALLYKNLPGQEQIVWETLFTINVLRHG
jgi:hypothetical protein